MPTQPSQQTTTRKSLLFQSSCAINEHIKIIIPTVGDVLDNEDEYYNTISLLTAMPYDLMAQLDDIGVDFTTLNEYELFLLLFEELKRRDTSLIFGDLNLSNFCVVQNVENNNLALADMKNKIVIDRAIHDKIARTLRDIHHLEKNLRKPANEEAKEFLITQAKKKLKRKKRDDNSHLEGLIVSMVNTEQFKYNFDQVKSISIYQFNESVKQIAKKIDYDNIMRGIYAGTISAKEFSQDDLTWLSHK